MNKRFGHGCTPMDTDKKTGKRRSLTERVATLKIVCSKLSPTRTARTATQARQHSHCRFPPHLTSPAVCISSIRQRIDFASGPNSRPDRAATENEPGAKHFSGVGLFLTLSCSDRLQTGASQCNAKNPGVIENVKKNCMAWIVCKDLPKHANERPLSRLFVSVLLCPR